LNKNVLKRIVMGDKKSVFHIPSRNKTSDRNLAETKEIKSSESDSAKIAGEKNG
jgi:hypothetical protein